MPLNRGSSEAGQLQARDRTGISKWLNSREFWAPSLKEIGNTMPALIFFLGTTQTAMLVLLLVSSQVSLRLVRQPTESCHGMNRVYTDSFASAAFDATNSVGSVALGFDGF